jgi:predicted nucleotidyltransferase
LFGGSVAKHTYVDGLSDIDSLLVINGSDLAEGTPREALKKIEKILSGKLGDEVLTPIRDKTGQSVHVDGYLGSADSEARRNASHLLGGIAKRMRSASTAASKEQWAAIFDEET